jgi:hypothetical protein
VIFVFLHSLSKKLALGQLTAECCLPLLILIVDICAPAAGAIGSYAGILKGSGSANVMSGTTGPP